MTHVIVRYGLTAMVSAALGGGAAAWWVTQSMQSAVDAEIQHRQAAELTFYQSQKATAELHAAALQRLVTEQQEQQQKNADLSNKLYAALTGLSQTAKRIENQIPAALARDGAGYNGIGPDGLQLYQQALGYSHTAVDRVGLSGDPHRPAATAPQTRDAPVRDARCAAGPCQPVRSVESGTGPQVTGHSDLGGTATGTTP
ncbi:hypothetical protein HZS38_09200 [Xenorhabdus nematophila]|uniref:hypothetical protein n=1 Tax=Xenorhabdus nematophila TaxID=628 RepID=UPI000542D9EB|nr:hypothetical protein [Xenorhabdus nematophila]MBA0019300.1 hypothetical protein [Xenorhabdus nematophila]MCB4425581.1 hypothetical protein [Xenorhabdus nematophila]QNJ38197.1 hypothetical protein H8F46_08915 [Xenorhabdus nematophila]CEF30130.1 hypothetical protein; putative exported protein [Xenorhabdus nematophila str. Websteri]